MNLTPGHFRTHCCLEYSTRENPTLCPAIECIPKYGFFVQNIIIKLSVLDLYK